MLRGRYLIVLGVAIAASSTAAVAQNSAVARAAEYVVTALQGATDGLNDRGWIIRQGFVGHVDSSGTFSHTIRTDRAQRFLVKGFCDQECSDMDLELVTTSGQVLIADTDVDDTPELRFTASQVGNRGATVRVKMYDCSTNVCYYSTGVYSR
jgi:hypothetical protein